MRADYETSATVHSRVRSKVAAAPVTSIKSTRLDADGNPESYVATTNEEMLNGLTAYWRPIFQMELNDELSEAKGRDVLHRIEASMKHRLTPEERTSVTMDAVLTRANLREAIARVKKHTAPGADGVPISLSFPRKPGQSFKRSAIQFAKAGSPLSHSM